MTTAPQAGIGESSARVLVVDDEIDTLELARALLEPLGYMVDTAMDGRLGLAAARAVAYDVVVLDIIMPNMDGIELGTALRANRSTANSMIIVHSALGEERVRGLFPEFDLFLAKPEQSNRLAESVTELLRDRDRRRAGMRST
jgi:CheY-like chemotaxis protein